MADRQNPRQIFKGERGEIISLEANLRDHTIEAVCQTWDGELVWVFRALHEDSAVDHFAKLLPAAAAKTWTEYLQELGDHKEEVAIAEAADRQRTLDALVARRTELMKGKTS